MTDTPHTPATEHDEDLVTLHTFQYRHQALIAKGHLEQEGVLTFLADENVGLHAMAVGGSRLQVAQKDFDRASSLIKELDMDNFPGEQPESGTD